MNEKSLNDGLIAFMAFLGRDSLNIGCVETSTMKCYQAIYKTPGFIASLLKYLEENKISDVLSMTWFIMKVCQFDHCVRDDENILQICTFLREHHRSSNADQLLTLVHPSLHADARPVKAAITSLDELKALEPQHDNDFPTDYRRIHIVPTVDELNHMGTSSVPLLPAPSDFEDRSSVEAAMLDRQFRLLRQDMVSQIVEELHEDSKLPINKRYRLFTNPTLVGIESETKSFFHIQVQTPPMLSIEAQTMQE
jgi:hypothetical protein